MPGAADPLEPLWRGIRALRGRSPTTEERRRFARYLELLRRWNRSHRLTALASPEAIARGLFLDSLLFLPLLPPRPLRLADIGAGAGIPGVPLHLVDPGVEPTLIESRRKRVSFLQALKRDLGLDRVRILEGRAEALVSQEIELSGRFDAVVTRAAGSLDRLLPIALRYLAPGGRFIASGPPAGKRLPSPPGQADWQTIPFPALGLTRVFLLAEKI